MGREVEASCPKEREFASGSYGTIYANDYGDTAIVCAGSIVKFPLDILVTNPFHSG